MGKSPILEAVPLVSPQSRSYVAYYAWEWELVIRLYPPGYCQQQDWYASNLTTMDSFLELSKLEMGCIIPYVYMDIRFNG